MAILTGSMGEPTEDTGYCEPCRARMQKYGVAPFYCDCDGTIDTIDACFAEVMAARARKAEDWVMA